MKLCFFISSINSKSKGLGGHYYSLLEIVDQLSYKHDIIIINIGNIPAKAFENVRHKVYYIIDGPLGLFRTYNSVKKIINSENPDILHAFDALAFFWVRILGFNLNLPICITKCGGVNPVYFPFSKYIILFSLENFKYFELKNKFKDSKIFLIPNRIKKFEDDNIRIDKILSIIPKGSDFFKFLRIARIGKYYHKSSLQLINLNNKLNEDGVNSCAVFIGTVEDDKYLNELKNNSKGNCFFFTDLYFTKNAKTLINFSDAVLGTGRSFMEAASKRKILLAPLKNSLYPLLISETNFNKAFYYNFSERIELDNFSEESNYNYIKNLIINKELIEINKKNSKNLFSEFFDSSSILSKYENFYFDVLKSKSEIKVWDFFLHFGFLLRSYFKK